MPGRALFRKRRARPTLHGSGRFPLPARRRFPWRRLSARRPGDERGQALVEFAVVLMPVLLLIVGIIQFGLLFGANVTLTNAAREATRAGTIYVYDHSHTKAWNDAERCGDVVEAARQSMGFLSVSSPQFITTLNGSGACSMPVDDGQTNGDLTISYCDHVTTPDGACPDTTDPDTTCIPDTREACLLRITLTYRSDIIVPLIGGLIGSDANGRFAQRATATMVVN
jgi:Flp pilus assembly protein TadG